MIRVRIKERIYIYEEKKKTFAKQLSGSVVVERAERELGGAVAG